MNKKPAGSILTVSGLLLCLAAIGLTGYNIWDDKRADMSVKSVLEQMTQPVHYGNEADPSEQTDTHTLAAYVSDPDMEMPATEIDGYLYIGVLEIPGLGLELPVMDSWDYARMKLAPCRYSGSAYSKDLIIAAHNYSSHFGTLQDLKPSDEIIFTDMDGNKFRYSASMMEVLDGTAVEQMENGEWDLTLFTCTISGQARVTVRCTMTDEIS